ncbi:hypothetical protein SCHPADRAFT_850808 [Schizopora paradoxa]|uniref:GmrSD restriction endonucleases N-terminal domain-containing protein n=1 Tax=Schizopora paradoxa TaxID=27342 RepID=A0A0H2RS07_9AGAM|nr:hypothetical protein SCHPADRAFT_850808 [Schizopora paradoxa]
MSEMEVDELDSEYGDAEEYEYEVDETDSGPKPFSIKTALPEPTHGRLSTQDLHKMIHDGEIDVNPEYQRDVVWPAEKQCALIESIFLNYYVPPLLFVVKNTEEEVVRVCMDGKQRLTSVQMFYSGQIPYKDPRTGKKFYYTIPEHQKGKRALVPQKFKDIFAKKLLNFVEYRDISETVERDIFQRVQMGVTLTAAEKLQAISSPYADWIRTLDSKYVQAQEDSDSLSQTLDWDIRRGRNFQCLTQLVFCCLQLPQHADATSAKKLGTWLTRIDGPPPNFKKQIEDCLREFYTIASDETLSAPFKTVKERVSPIEFVFIGVLIYVLSDYNSQFKSSEIQKLRLTVRKEHKDRRFNTRVQSTLWNFIDEAKKRATGTVGIVAMKKRKKGADEEDDDYRSAPVKAVGPAPTTRTKKVKQ